MVVNMHSVVKSLKCFCRDRREHEDSLVAGREWTLNGLIVVEDTVVIEK